MLLYTSSIEDLVLLFSEIHKGQNFQEVIARQLYQESKVNSAWEVAFGEWRAGTWQAVGSWSLRPFVNMRLQVTKEPLENDLQTFGRCILEDGLRKWFDTGGCKI